MALTFIDLQPPSSPRISGPISPVVVISRPDFFKTIPVDPINLNPITGATKSIDIGTFECPVNTIWFNNTSAQGNGLSRRNFLNTQELKFASEYYGVEMYLSDYTIGRFFVRGNRQEFYMGDNVWKFYDRNSQSIFNFWATSNSNEFKIANNFGWMQFYVGSSFSKF